MSLANFFRRVSFKNIVESVGQMIQRFPFAIAASLVSTWLGIYLIEMQNGSSKIAEKAVLISTLGFPLFVALVLVSERFNLKRMTRLVLQAGGLAALTLYYFLLPETTDFKIQHSVTIFLLNVIFYLSVLFIPFVKNNKSLANWNYIKTLFIKLFITGIFAGTLFAGLALSLWAIDYLFSVKIDEEVYAQMWVTIVGIFATWFYLSTFPKNPEQELEKFDYPKVLKVFVQYILVPLLSIFYIILYTYLGKIVFTWNWPLGGVSLWILAFSIIGVITYLISYPLLKNEDSTWIQKFFKAFFALILPLSIVLFMAIGIRIKEYGVTEQRYMVVLFGFWLIAVSIYYLLSKKKEVKFVPALTVIFFLFSLWGPWSMFSVSQRSQLVQLEGLLVKNNILVNGKIQKVERPQEIDYKDIESIRSKTGFVVEHGGTEKIQPWFSENLLAINRPANDILVEPQKIRDYEIEDNALAAMGLKGYSRYDSVYESHYFSFSNRGLNQAVLTSGYEYVFNDFRVSSFEIQGIDYTVGEKKLRVKYNVNGFEIWNGENNLATVDAKQIAQKLLEKYGKKEVFDIPQSDLFTEVENDKIKLKMYYSQITGDDRSGEIKLTNLSGTLLFSLK